MIKLHNIDFNPDLQPLIKDYLLSSGVELSQSGIHFGNCCLVNIPDNMIEDIINKFPDVQYRNAKHIIESSDLLTYHVGDKITIEYMSTDFFPIHNEKVTVHAVSENELITRAYKKRYKGWRIRAGEDCIIKNQW